MLKISRSKTDKIDKELLILKALIHFKFFYSLLTEVIHQLENEKVGTEDDKEEIKQKHLQYLNSLLALCWHELKRVNQTYKNANNASFQSLSNSHHDNQQQLLKTFNKWLSFITPGTGIVITAALKELISFTDKDYHSISATIKNSPQKINFVGEISEGNGFLYISGFDVAFISSEKFISLKNKLINAFNEFYGRNISIKNRILNEMAQDIKNLLMNFIEIIRSSLEEKLKINLLMINPTVKFLQFFLEKYHLMPEFENWILIITTDFLEEYKEFIQPVFDSMQEKIERADYYIQFYETNKNGNEIISKENLLAFLIKAKSDKRVTFSPELEICRKVFELSEDAMAEIAAECMQREEELNNMGGKIADVLLREQSDLGQFPIQSLSKLKLTGSALFLKNYLDNILKDNFKFILNQRVFLSVHQQKSPSKIAVKKLAPAPTHSILKPDKKKEENDIKKSKDNDAVLTSGINPKEKKPKKSYSVDFAMKRNITHQLQQNNSYFWGELKTLPSTNNDKPSSKGTTTCIVSRERYRADRIPQEWNNPKVELKKETPSDLGNLKPGKFK